MVTVSNSAAGSATATSADVAGVPGRAILTDAKQVYWPWLEGSTATGGVIIEHSQHQSKRMAEEPGHRYSVEDAAYLIEHHEQRGVQASDGRPWFFGAVRGEKALVVMSAAQTATGVYMLRRIKTMHRRPKPRRNSS